MNFIRYTQTEKNMCTIFIFGLSALRPRNAVRPRPVWTYFNSSKSTSPVDLWPFIFPSWRPQWLGLPSLFSLRCSAFAVHVKKLWITGCTQRAHSEDWYPRSLIWVFTWRSCVMWRQSVGFVMLQLKGPFSTELSRDMIKPTMWVCAQRRLRSAWASAQSDQSLRCAING